MKAQIVAHWREVGRETPRGKLSGCSVASHGARERRVSPWTASGRGTIDGVRFPLGAPQVQEVVGWNPTAPTALSHPHAPSVSCMRGHAKHARTPAAIRLPFDSVRFFGVTHTDPDPDIAGPLLKAS